MFNKKLALTAYSYPVNTKAQNFLKAALTTAISGTLLASVSAFAQTAETEVTKASSDKNKSSSVLDFEEIIVTGGARGQSQFEASYAVTSLSNDAITKLAPLNTADLVGLTPGIYTESTGGEVQNIYRIRAIPNEGSFTSFQDNGLPVMGYSQGFFVGADNVLRVDIMTENFEVVRGGPAPVIADNAIAIFNNVSRRGNAYEKGAVRLTVGDIGLGRIDGYWSGPLSKKTTLALGGFARVSDGYRDSGYIADEGGQFRINLTHELDDGSFNLYGRYLNDKNAFYLPIPVANAETGESLSHLMDPLTGTMNSEYLQAIKLVNSDGDGGKYVDDRNLSDGRHIELKSIGLEFEKQINDIWHITNKFLYTDINVSFDALYSGDAPSDATNFAGGYLDAAQAAWGDDVATIDYQYAITGETFDPSTTADLVLPGTYRAVDNELFTFVNDFRLTGQLGDHDVTIGTLLSRYGETAQRRYMNYIFEMRSRPQPLDLIARDAAGKELGSVTKNGVLQQGAFAQAFTETANHIAIYVSDNWQVTKDFRLEGGIRYQNTDYQGGRWGQETVNLGDQTILADDAVMGITGLFNPTGDTSSNSLSWTVGANYNILDNVGVYTRASRSHSVGELYSQSGGNTDETIVTQYEFGVKYDTKILKLFATAFHITFDPMTENLDATNAAGDILTEKFTGKAVAPGLELLAVLSPVDWLSLTANLAFAEPELNNLTSQTSGSTAIAPDGNVTRRQPKNYGYISPEVYFDAGDAMATAYLRYNFVGERFVDYNNSTMLPAYQTLSAGLSFDWDSWQIQVVGDNLTNVYGLTEGNPRNDAVSGQGTPEANYGRPLFGRNLRITATYNFF
jgi:iron complex outermembrane receptor protein